MGSWMTVEAVELARETANSRCVRVSGHEQISKTMPFCRHCGNLVPKELHPMALLLSLILSTPAHEMEYYA